MVHHADPSFLLAPQIRRSELHSGARQPCLADQLCDGLLRAPQCWGWASHPRPATVSAWACLRRRHTTVWGSRTLNWESF